VTVCISWALSPIFVWVVLTMVYNNTHHCAAKEHSDRVSNYRRTLC
jgi:hypothetical protein